MKHNTSLSICKVLKDVARLLAEKVKIDLVLKKRISRMVTLLSVDPVGGIDYRCADEKLIVERRGILCAVGYAVTSSFRISQSSMLENKQFSQKLHLKISLLRYRLKLSNFISGCEVAVLHLLLIQRPPMYSCRSADVCFPATVSVCNLTFTAGNRTAVS